MTTPAPMMSIAAAIAGLDAITALLSVGGTGTISIWDNTGGLGVPASLKVSPTGTLLSSGMTLNSTAFITPAVDSSSTGLATATANAIAADTNAAASGTALYFRALNHAGTPVIQGICGTSSADMILSTLAITAGETVSATSWVITLPDGSGVD